jgi:hypothetical protein
MGNRYATRHVRDPEREKPPMRLSTLDFVILVLILLCSALLVAGCCHAPPIPADPQQCCQRLKARSATLKRFERVCIGLAFLEGRYSNDPKVVKNIKEGLDICKYVFAVKKTKDRDVK